MSQHQQETQKSPMILLLSLALLVIATLVVITTYFLRPGMEHDLKHQLRFNFYQAGINDATIEVEGRDVILRGAVKNSHDAIQAETIARQTPGIHHVENHLVINNSAYD